MFFDQNLMENKCVADLWRTAHEFEPNHREISRPLHVTCRKLDSWLCSEGLDSQRLSLRTSSTLVAGAAKVLLREIRSLFNDAQGMEKDLMLARKRLSVIMESPTPIPSSSPSSSPPPTPELMMKQATNFRSTSVTNERRKRRLEIIATEHQNSFDCSRYTMSFSDDSTKRKRFQSICNENGCETEDYLVCSPENVEVSRSPGSKEQATQTDLEERPKTVHSNGSIDTTRPYGCVFVYGKMSVVPSHVLVCNVDPQALYLARY